MPMPSPRDPSAPKFDGQPRTLTRFLKEVYLVGKGCSLTDPKIIEWSIMYAEHNDSELWEQLPECHKNNWELFRNAITRLYPGADEDRKYSVNDLHMLAHDNVDIPIQRPDQFGKFYRDFLRISTFLKNKSRLSDFEAASMFMDGLHINFRRQVCNRLRLKHPDHYPDDPWTFTDIANAAIFIVSPSSANEPAPSTAIEATNIAPLPLVCSQINSTDPVYENPSGINSGRGIEVESVPQETGSANVNINQMPSFNGPPPGLSRVSANAPINIRPTSTNPTATEMSGNIPLPFASADAHQVKHVDEILNEQYKPHNLAISAASTDTLDPDIDLVRQIKSCQPTELLATQTVPRDLHYGSVAASTPVPLRLTGLQSSYSSKGLPTTLHRQNPFYRFLWFPARKKRLKCHQRNLSRSIDWEVNIQSFPRGRDSEIHANPCSQCIASDSLVCTKLTGLYQENPSAISTEFDNSI